MSFGFRVILAGTFSVVATVLLPNLARATPILLQISPVATSYVFATAVSNGFTQYPLSAVGDVTANLEAVDLSLPLLPSTSGCEAADFSGFSVGSIALLQRGTCEFGVKAANAAAAGAAAALIFDNQPNISVNIVGTVDPGIPTLYTTLQVGENLAALLGAGPVVLRIAVTSRDDVAGMLPSVALPASAPLFGVALVTLGLAGLSLNRKKHVTA